MGLVRSTSAAELAQVDALLVLLPNSDGWVVHGSLVEAMVEVAEIRDFAPLVHSPDLLSSDTDFQLAGRWVFEAELEDSGVAAVAHSRGPLSSDTDLAFEWVVFEAVLVGSGVAATVHSRGLLSSDMGSALELIVFEAALEGSGVAVHSDSAF